MNTVEGMAYRIWRVSNTLVLLPAFFGPWIGNLGGVQLVLILARFLNPLVGQYVDDLYPYFCIIFSFIFMWVYAWANLIMGLVGTYPFKWHLRMISLSLSLVGIVYVSGWFSWLFTNYRPWASLNWGFWVVTLALVSSLILEFTEAVNRGQLWPGMPKKAVWKRARLALLAIVAVIPLAIAVYVPGSGTIALVNGTVIDGTGAPPLKDAVVIIDQGVIVRMGPRTSVAIPAAAQVIDVKGGTILPGLINAHVHSAYVNSTLAAFVAQGITTVRDLGEMPVHVPVFALHVINQTHPVVARLVVSGPFITVPGGYPVANFKFPSLTVTSTLDARQKVNLLLDEGADVIKIAVDSSVGPTLSLEEIQVITQTAHARGVRVAAHVTRVADLDLVLDGGVDDIAHMVVGIRDDQIQRMAATGIYIVPTLGELQGRGVDGTVDLRRVLAGGVKVALGTDAGIYSTIPVGLPLDEFHLMAQSGMTPMQIIVASTSNAAYVSNLDDKVGCLRVGMVADVLVVNGNPLENIDALGDIFMVLHNGDIVKK